MGDEADSMWDREMIDEGYEAFRRPTPVRRKKRRKNAEPTTADASAEHSPVGEA